MSKHQKQLLDKLIQKYENSAHANPNKDNSKRRIMFHLKSYHAYDVQDFDSVEEINADMEELQNKGYIQIVYDQEHTNHMKTIILNLEHVNDIYQEYYGKQSKNDEAQQLSQLLHDYQEKIKTPWIQSFIQDEQAYLVKNGTLHKYVGKDMEHIKQLFMVLDYIDEGRNNFMRAMSNALFHDTKYFENELKSSFLSLIHRYEPNYLMAKADDYEMRESEIFRSLGFQLYPEEFAWCAPIQLYLKDGTCIDTTPFQKGFILNGDMLSDIEHMEIQAKRLVLIENKANYYSRIKEKRPDEAIVFAGGHFSPVRKQLYECMREGFHGEIYLSSDIDLGGFLMFARLKEEVFPNLKPYHMSLDIYEKYLKYARSVDEAYLDKIEKARDREDLTIFHDVMDAILKHRKALEQEAMIIKS
ncbi:MULTISPECIES: Wadjet anti-phage system protein JetD domain-containing protein [unclassified Amedibacterium]|uniref:Wadjet anti-phage system protein JetD domain-containing protein n=1 Tax=unclassified Amedibacterium TaxID=3088137 RepID=UPI000E3EFC8E|nr:MULTISPECIES: Wadjet anti-phage system protein JetD domain-containing protein [unclassified Absiella]RGB65509.1 hypothetical protein DW113_11880 [Absiella sp. AM09-45]RGB74495.1 hypothetical protein DW114_13565 [Absiella sp. AM09-50]RGC53224.1 hypothetical protein DW761_02390 [Absiella sp. AM29-15]